MSAVSIIIVSKDSFTAGSLSSLNVFLNYAQLFIGLAIAPGIAEYPFSKARRRCLGNLQAVVVLPNYVILKVFYPLVLIVSYKFSVPSYL